MEPPIYTDPATGRRYYVGADGQSRWLEEPPLPQSPGALLWEAQSTGPQPWGMSSAGRSARHPPVRAAAHCAPARSGPSRRTKAELIGAGAVLLVGIAIGDASNHSPQPISGSPLAGSGAGAYAATTAHTGKVTAKGTGTAHSTPKKSATTAPPATRPTSKSQTTSTPKRTTEPKKRAGTPKPTPTEPETAYYQNCSQARAAGAAPLHRGDPGYRRALDRDNDGVACE